MWPFTLGSRKISKLYLAADAEGLAEIVKNEKCTFSTRVSAVEALGRLCFPKTKLKAAVLDRLASEFLNLMIDLRAVEPLIAALKNKDLYAGAAADALGQIGDLRAVEPLIAALKNKDLYAGAAADALGQIGDLRAVEPLIAALKDKDLRHAVYAQGAAADALGQIGDLRAVEPLIAALKYNSTEAAAAAELLGQIGDLRAVEPLIAALEDPLIAAGVRNAAIKALGDLRAVEPLIAALALDDPHRESVIKALGQIGDARAVKPLIAAALYDSRSNRSVRVAVADALSKIAAPDESETRAEYWVATRNWDKCVQMGAPAVGPLIAALEKYQGDGKQAAEALGQIGEPAIKPLINVLRRWTTNESGTAHSAWVHDVRKLAGEALSLIGLSAVEPLIAVQSPREHRSVQEEAARALEQIRSHFFVSGREAQQGAAARREEVKRDAVDPGPSGRISRNAPCPCGSNKKFKHCHGRISNIQPGACG